MVFIEKSIFIILKKIDLYFSHLLDYTDPKYPKHSFSTLSETEIEKILKGIKTDHPLCVKGKAILELAYSSALRTKELYNLKIIDIDFKKDYSLLSSQRIIKIELYLLVKLPSSGLKSILQK